MAQEGKREREIERDSEWALGSNMGILISGLCLYSFWFKDNLTDSTVRNTVETDDKYCIFILPLNILSEQQIVLRQCQI